MRTTFVLAFVRQSVLCILLLGLAQTANAKQFATTDGFSLELPPGWIQIPAQVIDEYSLKVAAAVPNVKPLHPNYAFQFGKKDSWFSYPYVLIIIKKTGRPTEAQLKNLNAASTGAAVEKLQNNLQQLITGLEVGQFRYDEATKIVWMNMGVSVTDVGRISGVSAIVPTEYGVVQIQGYAKEADYMGFLSVFQHLVESLHLKDDVRYQSHLSTSDPADNLQRQSHLSTNDSFLASITHEDIIKWAVQGAFFGLLASALAMYRKKWKNEKIVQPVVTSEAVLRKDTPSDNEVTVQSHAPLTGNEQTWGINKRRLQLIITGALTVAALIYVLCILVPDYTAFSHNFIPRRFRIEARIDIPEILLRHDDEHAVVIDAKPLKQLTQLPPADKRSTMSNPIAQPLPPDYQYPTGGTPFPVEERALEQQPATWNPWDGPPVAWWEAPLAYIKSIKSVKLLSVIGGLFGGPWLCAFLVVRVIPVGITKLLSWLMTSDVAQ